MLVSSVNFRKFLSLLSFLCFLSLMSTLLPSGKSHFRGDDYLSKDASGIGGAAVYKEVTKQLPHS